MNRVYKVIWSKAKHCYVVTSEIARSVTKSASSARSAGRKGAAILAMAALLFTAGGVLGEAAYVTEIHVKPGSSTADVIEVKKEGGETTYITINDVDHAIKATSDRNGLRIDTNYVKNTDAEVEAGGTYVNEDNTVGKNLSALDNQVKKNTEAVVKVGQQVGENSTALDKLDKQVKANAKDNLKVGNDGVISQVTGDDGTKSSPVNKLVLNKDGDNQITMDEKGIKVGTNSGVMDKDGFYAGGDDYEHASAALKWDGSIKGADGKFTVDKDGNAAIGGTLTVDKNLTVNGTFDSKTLSSKLDENNYTTINGGKTESKNLKIDVKTHETQVSASTFDETGSNAWAKDDDSIGESSMTADKISQSLSDKGDNPPNAASRVLSQNKDNKYEIADVVSGKNGTIESIINQTETGIKSTATDGKNTASTNLSNNGFNTYATDGTNKTYTKQTAVDIKNTAEKGMISNTAKNLVNSASENMTNNVGKNLETTVGGEMKTTVTGKATEDYKSDLDTKVGGNETHYVKGNQTNTVSGDRTVSVKGTETENFNAQVTNIKTDQKTSVGGNQTNIVVGNQQNTVSGSKTESVKGAVTETYGSQSTTVNGNQSNTVTGTLTETVTGDVTEDYKANLSTIVGGNQTITVTGDSSLSAKNISNTAENGTITNTAKEVITKTGKNTVTSNTDGTTFENEDAKTPFVKGGEVNTKITGNKVETGKVLTDDLTVRGTSEFVGRADFRNDVYVDENLTVAKETRTGTLYVNNDGYVDGNLYVEGNIETHDAELSETSRQVVTGRQLYQTNERVDRLDNRIKKVGANAAALAALRPGDFNPDDKFSIAAGFGSYRNASAAALGLFYRPNENVILSLGTSFGDGENMVNAGVSVKFGRGKSMAERRKEMADEVSGMRDEMKNQNDRIAELEEMLKKQSELIEKLSKES